MTNLKAEVGVRAPDAPPPPTPLSKIIDRRKRLQAALADDSLPAEKRAELRADYELLDEQVRQLRAALDD